MSPKGHRHCVKNFKNADTRAWPQTFWVRISEACLQCRSRLIFRRSKSEDHSRGADRWRASGHFHGRWVSGDRVLRPALPSAFSNTRLFPPAVICCFLSCPLISVPPPYSVYFAPCLICLPLSESSFCPQLFILSRLSSLLSIFLFSLCRLLLSPDTPFYILSRLSGAGSLRTTMPEGF